MLWLPFTALALVLALGLGASGSAPASIELIAEEVGVRMCEILADQGITPPSPATDSAVQKLALDTITSLDIARDQVPEDLWADFLAIASRALAGEFCGDGEGSEPITPDEIEPIVEPDWRNFEADQLQAAACAMVNSLPANVAPPSAPVLSLDLLRSLFPSTSWPGAMGSDTYAYHTAVVSQLFNRILAGDVICDSPITIDDDASNATNYQIQQGDTLLGANGIIARRYPHLSSGQRVSAAKAIIADPLNRGILTKTRNEGNRNLIGEEMISFYPKHFRDPPTILARFLSGDGFAVVHLRDDL